MRDNASPPRANWKTILKIFLVSFRIGLFTFGGGGSMVLMMQHEFVDKQKWIDSEIMVDVLAVARSLPGSVAVNTSILAGYRIGGTRGGLAAGIGSVLPSFLGISVVTLFYTSLMQNEYFVGAIRGIRGAVVALLVATVFRLRRQSIQDLWGVLLFCLALCVIIFLKSVNVIFVILGGFFLGIVLYYWRKSGTYREDDGEGGNDV